MAKEKVTLGEGGGITYIKPGSLESGTTIAGTYLGLTSNADQFGKRNHRIKSSDGSSLVINSTGKLDKLMEKVSAGSEVEIVYLGKTKIQTGPQAGKQAHNFDVFVTGAAPAGSATGSDDGMPF